MTIVNKHQIVVAAECVPTSSYVLFIYWLMTLSDFLRREQMAHSFSIRDRDHLHSTVQELSHTTDKVY